MFCQGTFIIAIFSIQKCVCMHYPYQDAQLSVFCGRNENIETESIFYFSQDLYIFLFFTNCSVFSMKAKRPSAPFIKPE